MDYKLEAEEFMEKQRYKQPPYNKRNWGHPWHSLCSYHGKIKPSLAFDLVNKFTKEGETVLDPLSGVGTIPFEACLQNRIGIGNDLSDLAYNVTNAKLTLPNKQDVLERIEFLQRLVVETTINLNDYNIDFGLNRSVKDYFHKETLIEILILRNYFMKKENHDNVDSFIFACFAHVLHGNRPYALSRNSHPLTPYAPSGEYVYKNVIKHIQNKVELSFLKADKYGKESKVKGLAFNTDFRQLIKLIQSESIDSIITSPPFSNSIKFYSQNWLRLWLSGWEEVDFKEVNPDFLEIQQKQNLEIYKSFFEVCHKLLKPNGKVIMHLGKSNKVDMGLELSRICAPWFEVIHLADESVGHIEKHGIKDKGGTSDHQFLFLQKI